MRDNKTSSRVFGTLARCLLAFTAVLALHVLYEVSGGLETGNRLVDNLSRIPNSFSFGELYDPLLFAAIFWLLRRGRPGRAAWVLGLLFACLYTVSRSSMDLGSLSFFYANAYQLLLALLCTAALGLLFASALQLVFDLLEQGAPGEERPLRHPMALAALVMLLCWLPWLGMNYPCSFSPDSTTQLDWALNGGWSAHHPPLNTAIIWLCVTLGRAIRDVNLGCFFYVLLQSVTGALIFSYSLARLYAEGLPKRAWIGMLLFFAATPFWGCFAQWLEKDFLYAQMFTLDLVLLLPVLKARRCSAGRAALIGLVTLTAVLLRKTGLYELVPGLLVMALVLRRGSRGRLLCAAAAALVLSLAVNNVLYPALGIRSASVAEALSLPFQQTARYVNQYPDEVTAAEREAIDAVLVYDKLDAYRPEISDFVKNNYRGDNSALPAYLRTWAGMLVKHPLCYFEAGFMLSYGYLAPVRPALDAYIQSQYFPVAADLGVYRVFGDFPTRAFDSVREMFIEFPLTSLLCMAGLYTWALLTCLAALIRRKRGAALTLLIPGLMNVLICIASPLCAATRYELPVIASAPLILGWTMLNLRDRNRDAEPTGEGPAAE